MIWNITAAPASGGKNASVGIDVFVKNVKDSQAFVFTVTDREGNEIFREEDKDTAAVAEIENVHLWHGRKDPYLYTAKVELVEEDGKYTLKTNVYGLLQGFETNTIHSDVLGCAFQPEQRFENNDGSPIVFDRDFFGSHRGIAPLPGPFAAGIEEELFIWED